ncbi:MAG: flagellar basal body P-ring protein FlgI [Phycisphaerales bacterium JB040]
MRRAVVFMLVLGVCAFSALGQRTLREYGRLRGQDEYRLTGLGLVVGLNGTGDSGEELVVARPLAEALRALGNPIPDFSELENSQSVALVLVTATVPRAGMEVGDKLDVEVSVMHSAESLEGGMLLTCPLVSPVVRDTAFALAHGRVSVTPGGSPTAGTVSGGADAIRRVSNLPTLNGSFEVILDPHIAGWDVASSVATEINQQYLLTGSTGAEPLATVADPRTIRVRIPVAESAQPAAFVGDVLATDISSALRKLEARVICDTRTGVILLTGDVRVSPAVITHRDLTITTTVPAPVASVQNPLVEQNRWAAVNTEPLSPDTARLEDLIAAFDQLDVGARDQIQILEMLHRAGKLHARLIVDGSAR